MRAERIVARGFRNLADLDLTLPPAGAVFLGPNGHGKTNLLELLYYPVLFRSLRGCRDGEVTRYGEPGFHITLWGGSQGGQEGRETEGPRGPAWESVTSDYRAAGKVKRVRVDGSEPERLSDAIGRWLAVAFLPADLRLVQGPAAVRRHYLDRVLALADRGYLRALTHYRRALAQRNAALRQARADLAAAFDRPLAAAGAELVRSRLAWCRESARRYAEECDGLGEAVPMALRYRGDDALADPGVLEDSLRRAAARDQALGMTTVGPHRHDLELRLGGRLLREAGSTGQQRTGAIALKLCELATLGARAGTGPALLLDDVFAELDDERQRRLARRLLSPEAGSGPPQTFLTSPREGEVPEGFALERFSLDAGTIRRPGRREPRVA
jgi:DNA replication and repair protein RecF